MKPVVSLYAPDHVHCRCVVQPWDASREQSIDRHLREGSDIVHGLSLDSAHRRPVVSQDYGTTDSLHKVPY